MAEKSVICKVLRPFKYQGKVIDVGKTIELPESLAVEMKNSNKVKFSSDNSGGGSEKSEAVDPMDTVKSGKK